MSWTEALQKVTERERVLFDDSQQLWPVNQNALALKDASEVAISEESGEEESVDLEAEPARTSARKTKPLKVYGGDRAQTLVPGTYTYHLRWKLPRNLPLSFEEATSATWMASEGAVVPKMLSKGKSFIRYSATATLTICRQIQVKAEPMKGLPMDPTQPLIKEVNQNVSTHAHFKVIEDVPLIALTAQPPIQSSQEKTFLFASDAPLKLTITIANGGIAFAGKPFTATIGVDNKSSRTVDLVRIGIDCITTFRVTAPKVAPVQAGLAGSQVQVLHPELTAATAAGPDAANGNASGDWIDNVSRRENILNTTLNELANITGGATKASKISITIPTYWPGSIVTSVHIERRYEMYAECVVAMGTNLITRCPMRLLEWCDYFTRALPDLSPVVPEHDLEEFDISDSETDERTKKAKQPTTTELAASSAAVPTSSSTTSSQPTSSGIASSSNDVDLPKDATIEKESKEANNTTTTSAITTAADTMEDPAL